MNLEIIKRLKTFHIKIEFFPENVNQCKNAEILYAFTDYRRYSLYLCNE